MTCQNLKKCHKGIKCETLFSIFGRDPGSADRTAQMFGPAVRAPGAAPSGPAGLLPQEGRDRNGLLAQSGEAG